MGLTGAAGRRLVRGLGLLLAPAAVACGLVASAGAAGSVALTAEQRQRLADGEIVLLDARPPGASSSAGGGTAIAVVQGPVEQVWGVLTDYPGHPRYYPRVVDAEVLEVSGARVLVRYTVRIGLFTFRFHMRKASDPVGRRIEWHLAEDRANGLLRENSGYWLVEAHPSGSLVTYAIAVRSYVPAFLTAGSERDSLVETISGLRRVVAGQPGKAANRLDPGPVWADSQAHEYERDQGMSETLARRSILVGGLTVALAAAGGRRAAAASKPEITVHKSPT